MINQILSTSIITLVLMMLPLQTQALTLKIATLAPAGTSWMKEMKKGAKEIKAKTSGRVKFKFYPGGVMGNDASVHRKIRINQLQGGAFSSSGLSNIDTSIQLYSLPMLFQNFDEVDYVRARMDGILKQKMADAGFVLLGITEGGFARILSSKPINDLQSIRQTKVWMPEGDQLVSKTMEALEIQPIALPISDVFTGLQTGLIETITVTSTGAIAFQWHTKVSHMIETPVTYVIGTLAVSQKAFKKIKPDDQKIVIEEMNKVFARLDTVNRSDNINATKALETQGISINNPSAMEVENWRSRSNQSIQKMTDNNEIDPQLVKTLQQHLHDFRSGKN